MPQAIETLARPNFLQKLIAVSLAAKSPGHLRGLGATSPTKRAENDLDHSSDKRSSIDLPNSVQRTEIAIRGLPSSFQQNRPNLRRAAPCQSVANDLT